MTPIKTPSQLEEEKRSAARAALRWVRGGMTVGLGSGSTAGYFINYLGALVQTRQIQVQGVASSSQSEELARKVGIPIVAPARGLRLDLYVDGADQITPDFCLIKGRGGALLREKVLARAARFFLAIVDSSKCAERMGSVLIPIEVVPFALPWVLDEVQAMGADPVVRIVGQSPEHPFLTDQQNCIVDCRFHAVEDPHAVAARLEEIPGIVGHGLFLGLAHAAVVADGPDVYLFRPGTAPERILGGDE